MNFLLGIYPRPFVTFPLGLDAWALGELRVASKVDASAVRLARGCHSTSEQRVFLTGTKSDQILFAGESAQSDDRSSAVVIASSFSDLLSTSTCRAARCLLSELLGPNSLTVPPAETGETAT